MPPISLDDKYALEQGCAFMSGVQALVRLPMLQQVRDARLGKNTAGFISGYRGSPLGVYDLALWQAEKYLKAKNIVFKPGVNEELAAVAVSGTQQLGYAPPGTNKFDGVFGIWYGKGPGADRSCDVFKHANMAGTTPWGGVIAVVGDDHVAKSSTLAHQSDHIFKACGLPVFFPASVQEILDLGLHAFAMSRYAGVWAGMKTIQEVVESSTSAVIDPRRVQIKLPTDFEIPSGGVHIRWPDTPLEQEQRLFDVKWYAALAYIRANRLNYNVIEGPNDRLGLIASGKAYDDTRQALMDLGLDHATCQRLGIRLHKVGVVWPLEAQLTREFASGLQEILVIEEKRQVIEYQLKEELYNWRADVRPNVLGKFNEVEGDYTGGEWSMPNPTGNTLLRANADLSPALVAQAIAARVLKLGVDSDTAAHIEHRLAQIAANQQALQSWHVNTERPPWFCSGCPHNTSTRVPEGSRAMGGIGCHYMALWMDRSTVGFTPMGGEGVPWIGQQPFSTVPHIFANLGDGTYFHSGLLAIRQSIASGVNITYKILYNDVVAMTGGQIVGERSEGHSVGQIALSLLAEGAIKTVVVTDEPGKYDTIELAPGVTVHHRDELDDIQKEFRQIKGTTVIIYDQSCANEKRRKRKRGTLVDPAMRVVINELVCEGCGDCNEQSNCLSVEPVETAFGRKRQINQSSCNKDFSCLKGFCPSFVTVEGGRLRTPAASARLNTAQFGLLPQPSLPLLDRVEHGVWGTVVAGVGGTGVITVGLLLGMAAHLEGKGVVTQDAAGLAQKGGSTWSHVLISSDVANIYTTRVGTASADLILGCDPIVTAQQETMMRLCAGRTHVALNAHSMPTAALVHNRDWSNPGPACTKHIVQAAGEPYVGVFNASLAASTLMGASVYANLMLLGYAWQRGWVPLELASLLRAIELNATAVEQNKVAFEWGRCAAHQPDLMAQLLLAEHPISLPTARPSVAELVVQRSEFLCAYQNATYAQSYSDFVARVQQAEPAGKTQLSEQVAKYLFKLMAYKDEYEVARLHTDAAFTQKIAAQFEGPYKLHYHLAPPVLARGHTARKQKFGPWMRVVLIGLAQLKVLRGSWLDVFGYQAERKMERALMAQYRGLIEQLLPTLSAENYSHAIEVAHVPETIKGYGHIKRKSVEAALERWRQLMPSFAL